MIFVVDVWRMLAWNLTENGWKWVIWAWGIILKWLEAELLILGLFLMVFVFLDFLVCQRNMFFCFFVFDFLDL